MRALLKKCLLWTNNFFSIKYAKFSNVLTKFSGTWGSNPLSVILQSKCPFKSLCNSFVHIIRSMYIISLSSYLLSQERDIKNKSTLIVKHSWRLFKCWLYFHLYSFIHQIDLFPHCLHYLLIYPYVLETVAPAEWFVGLFVFSTVFLNDGIEQALRGAIGAQRLGRTHGRTDQVICRGSFAQCAAQSQLEARAKIVFFTKTCLWALDPPPEFVMCAFR